MGGQEPDYTEHRPYDGRKVDSPEGTRELWRALHKREATCGEWGW